MEASFVTGCQAVRIWIQWVFFHQHNTQTMSENCESDLQLEIRTMLYTMSAELRVVYYRSYGIWKELSIIDNRFLNDIETDWLRIAVTHQMVPAMTARATCNASRNGNVGVIQ